mmetsp:Transcript_30451/g.68766  ORF Transcript_30451/g.68766 Transcript_30451/m.68766 type:complete len:431 (+) Transcript_30451:48-1340(+)
MVATVTAGTYARLPSDPGCRTGLFYVRAQVCCAEACGDCGGSEQSSDCATRPGGPSSCCVDTIRTEGRSCQEHPPPCFMPQGLGLQAQPRPSAVAKTATAACEGACPAPSPPPAVLDETLLAVLFTGAGFVVTTLACLVMLCCGRGCRRRSDSPEDQEERVEVKVEGAPSRRGKKGGSRRAARTVLREAQEEEDGRRQAEAGKAEVVQEHVQGSSRLAATKAELASPDEGGGLGLDIEIDPELDGIGDVHPLTGTGDEPTRPEQPGGQKTKRAKAKLKVAKKKKVAGAGVASSSGACEPATAKPVEGKPTSGGKASKPGPRRVSASATQPTCQASSNSSGSQKVSDTTHTTKSRTSEEEEEAPAGSRCVPRGGVGSEQADRAAMLGELLAAMDQSTSQAQSAASSTGCSGSEAGDDLLDDIFARRGVVVS